MTTFALNSPVFVSLCPSAASTACSRIGVADVLARIRAGEWADRVQTVRDFVAAGDRDAANAVKRTLPGVLFSGEFSVRKKAGLVRHSGLLCADFDHVPDPADLRGRLAADPRCVAAFRSPSGDGVKALFAVDPDRPQAESWRAVDAHCRAAFGLDIDPACKDAARLCFVSYDPDAHLAAGEVPRVDYPPPDPSDTGEEMAGPVSIPGASHGLLSPGDDFNVRGDVAAILRKHGWTSDDDEEWTRPGKTSGVSATLGRLDNHARGFWSYTSNPQAAPILPEKLYQPWHVFAVLEHGGDWNAAACALRALGYGAATTEDLGPLYFDGGTYWRMERDGRFGRLTRTDALLHLKMQGHSARAPKGVEVSPLDRALHEVQRQNRVTYAAPFCGRQAGLYQENGHAILATDSPTVIPAGEGDHAPLENFFRHLFGLGQDPHAHTQFETFVGWLQRTRRALANPGQHLPGQALFLIGPAACGKTLAQTLITYLAGGRSADPSGWVFKDSDFNDGLWGAEILTLSDANVEDVAGARRKLRDRLKQLVANDLAPCHRKHRGEISLRPIWRVVVSANPDADSASVIPNLDESIADKVIYLRCYAPTVPFPTATPEGAASFMRSLKDAAPAFLSGVEAFEVPAELVGPRFGVREFHHPHVVEMLSGTHPDAGLGEQLERWLDGPSAPGAASGPDRRGTASELFVDLEGVYFPNFAKTCRSALVLGQALRRLANAPGWHGRISSETVRVGANRSKQTVWTVRKDPAA